MGLKGGHIDLDLWPRPQEADLKRQAGVSGTAASSVSDIQPDHSGSAAAHSTQLP